MLISLTLGAFLAVAPAPAEKRSLGEQFDIAIERADLATVKALVEGGADPETPIQFGENSWTPLIKAAREGRAAIVRFLLEKGAKVNAASSDGGELPLSQAASRGYDDVVEILLRAGADAKAKNKDGYTAFFFAASEGHLDVADMLLAAGADVNAEDRYGITALMTASSICNPELLRYLASKGAKLNKISQLEYGGSTALTTAASVAQVDCVKTLLELGADPGLKMKSGETALTNAEQSKNPEVVALIKAALAKAPPKASPKTAPKKTP
jgi:ankyrin repeat protein